MVLREILEYASPTMNKMPYPAIRSFVLRQGRMTLAQRRALEVLWEKYGIDYIPEPIDFSKQFGRSAKLVLEVGFGDGRSVVEQAKNNPELNYLGIEVHGPGVGKLMDELQKQEITNVRIIQHDAVEVLKHCIPDVSLHGVQVFFPDPWPKKRHQKRRIIQSSFVDLIVSKLETEGFIHCATDWENYAEQMMNIISENHQLKNIEGEGLFYSAPYTRRDRTKFEQRGEKLGHKIYDLVFLKRKN